MKKNSFLVILMVIILFAMSNGQEPLYKGRYVYYNPTFDRLEFIKSSNSEHCNLPIWIHPSLTDKWPTYGEDQVEDAIIEWNTVNANLSLINMGVEQPPNISYEGSILHRQNNEPGNFADQYNLIAVDLNNVYEAFIYPWEFENDDHKIALVKIWYDENNKECNNGSEYDYLAPVITEADCIISPYAPIEDIDLPQQSGDVYYCLQDILTHEIGHIMGLNHFGSSGCIMNRRRFTDLFLCDVDWNSSYQLKDLYCDNTTPSFVVPYCTEENFSTTTNIENCIAGKNYYNNGGTSPPDPPPEPWGCCGPCSGNKGISDVAVKNAINFYTRLEYQPDFDSLIYLVIENYSLFAEAIDDQIEYKGKLNEGGIIVESDDAPSNRIASTSSDVFYENYPEFNRKLQIAINEFVPIFNKEFNCDCDESTTHLDDRQINIILDLVAEVKNMPISEGLSNELIKFENYLNNRDDNDIKTDIINYLSYY